MTGFTLMVTCYIPVVILVVSLSKLEPLLPLYLIICFLAFPFIMVVLRTIIWMLEHPKQKAK